LINLIIALTVYGSGMALTL